MTFRDGKFSNTPEADHFLVKGKPAYLGGRHAFYTARYNELLHTAVSIRTGSPQAKLDFTGMPPEALEAYLRGLHPGTKAIGRVLTDHLDFSSYQHLLDVRGGSGDLSIVISTLTPGLRGTVLEMPSVAMITKLIIEEEGLADRITVAAADAIQGPLTGAYDVAVLRAFFQVLFPEEAGKVLGNLFRVLEPGSPIVIVGQVLDDSCLSPPETVTFNLIFINVYDEGRAYTEEEYRRWLTKAGFVGMKRMLLSGGENLITANKPA